MWVTRTGRRTHKLTDLKKKKKKKNTNHTLTLLVKGISSCSLKLPERLNLPKARRIPAVPWLEWRDPGKASQFQCLRVHTHTLLYTCGCTHVSQTHIKTSCAVRLPAQIPKKKCPRARSLFASHKGTKKVGEGFKGNTSKLEGYCTLDRVRTHQTTDPRSSSSPSLSLTLHCVVLKLRGWGSKIHISGKKMCAPWQFKEIVRVGRAMI